jgi:hypothetical protein
MPDIQTALATALTQNRVREIPADWDETNSTKESTVKQLFKPSNNVTRETFNIVRDNPGQTFKQIITHMVTRGFNKASVGSLLGQLVRSNMLELHKITHTYHALTKEYTPIKLGTLKRSRMLEKKAAKKAAQVPKQLSNTVAGIATLNAPHTQATLAPPVTQQLTAKQVLETLSIKEAHVLYRELQTMFGD